MRYSFLQTGWRRHKEDNLFTGMLFDTHGLAIGKVNEILRQKKFPPLTERRDEELVC